MRAEAGLRQLERRRLRLGGRGRGSGGRNGTAGDDGGEQDGECDVECAVGVMPLLYARRGVEVRRAVAGRAGPSNAFSTIPVDIIGVIEHQLHHGGHVLPRASWDKPPRERASPRPSRHGSVAHDLAGRAGGGCKQSGASLASAVGMTWWSSSSTSCRRIFGALRLMTTSRPTRRSAFGRVSPPPTGSPAPSPRPARTRAQTPSTPQRSPRSRSSVASVST